MLFNELIAKRKIHVERFRKVRGPSRKLVGKTLSVRHIPIEEFEEKAESGQSLEVDKQSNTRKALSVTLIQSSSHAIFNRHSAKNNPSNSER